MNKAKVYFLKLNELDKIRGLLPVFIAPLGIKVHFGEKGNITFLPARYVKQIAEMVENPTLVETNVLYRSPRSQASTHHDLAMEHGFNFAPIDFLDGDLGDDFMEVDIERKHFKSCFLGAGLQKYNSLLVLSHFKGHGAAIFGSALKNLGMGLASRRGKLAQHASIKHSIDDEKCISCGQCVSDCPVGAISLSQSKKAKIDHSKCISCSKCISICPVKAIGIPWESTEKNVLQERIAEYALAGVQNKKCFCINFLMNITSECDCHGKEMEKLCADIGVLASADPVAIDQASLDLVFQESPELGFKEKNIQTEYAEKIGLGTRKYEIINL